MGREAGLLGCQMSSLHVFPDGTGSHGWIGLRGGKSNCVYVDADAEVEGRLACESLVGV